jgi:hypothetical protein
MVAGAAEVDAVLAEPELEEPKPKTMLNSKNGASVEW